MLIIGGYGGFGARLTRRLLAQGHQVLVAGRSADKAEAFCAPLPMATAVVADRNGDLGPLLSAHHPKLVIDAAGPFQNSDNRLACACIAASIPYLDLADARAFVTQMQELDVPARDAGVAIISGASSVPALSGAVARQLAQGLSRVRRVEIAISASNRATAGSSVAAAILSYVGKPLQLWRGQNWDRAWGWQELRRQTFRLANGAALRNRWLALADVPDHDLLPAALPGRPAVTFRAGTEFAGQTLALWLASWPIRWIGHGSLAPLAPLLGPLRRLTARFSDERSAMAVTMTGEMDGRFIERQWTLIAANGDGPEIPTLAAALLAEKILAGEIEPGARDAGELLTLADFEPLFATLSIRHEQSQTLLPPPLYARVAGADFARLPEKVRTLHDMRGDGGASGEAQVERGDHPVAKFAAWMMGFPPAGLHKLHVAFSEENGVEYWTRRFGDSRFRSHLSAKGNTLTERFGPLRFRFDLPCDEKGLAMQIKGWSFCGLPLPLSAAPQGVAREWQEDGRFHFDVPIALPKIGLVVHYKGWLDPDLKT
ncbi:MULTISPECIES: SDR family oxidoreductase [unclassified Beijerinckia]|uniref:SDR family oxidoreductase n=1 Tax=unclassified Beijerinckia TaxID=2638183 RepID=UPI00089CA075|nr:MULTISPECIES: SDR family oxidoreductase [unclassified Beijerinckia]MDH7797209.1 NAD(P)-dependent dehydrogenase (short-subunit alcohol dehydrogenase family) [Beijerinckia sp. GAS462]SEC76397.1 Saccharopine dehydrogenase, NADP-dependent [Beijerinckia sp. 28-YEA-48]